MAWLHGLDAQDQAGRTGFESGIFLKTLSCYSDSFEAYDQFPKVPDVLGPETVLCSIAEGTLPMSLRSWQAMQGLSEDLQSQACREKHCSFFFFF